MRILRRFDPWRSKLCTCPAKYTINPYTGCSHFCLYCYATSYIGRKKSIPKENLTKNLIADVKNIDPKLPIDMSLSSDPYPPEERNIRLTRKVLEILLPVGLRLQITTKSDLYLLDIDLISKYNVAVSETITTLDNSLARKLEPNAPSPMRRIKALERLSAVDVPFSVRIDPIIPGLNDDPIEIKELVEVLFNIGAKHIVTSTYKARPDNFKRMINAFPEMENFWKKLYYPKGIKTRGYAYLPLEFRKKLLKPVVEEAKKYGMTYATCREGLITKEFFNTPSCDGTHLIPNKLSYNIKSLKQELLKINLQA